MLSWDEATTLARIHPDLTVRLFTRSDDAERFLQERKRSGAGLAVELIRDHPERRRELLVLGAWGTAARNRDYIRRRLEQGVAEEAEMTDSDEDESELPIRGAGGNHSSGHSSSSSSSSSSTAVQAGTTHGTSTSAIAWDNAGEENDGQN